MMGNKILKYAIVCEDILDFRKWVDSQEVAREMSRGAAAVFIPILSQSHIVEGLYHYVVPTKHTAEINRLAAKAERYRLCADCDKPMKEKYYMGDYHMCCPCGDDRIIKRKMKVPTSDAWAKMEEAYSALKEAHKGK